MFQIGEIKKNDARATLSALNNNDKRPSWDALQRLYKERDKRGRVYLFPEGETILENLCNRRTHPVADYKKLMPEILERAGIPAQKVSWSQKCGCSCGCSPGFILSETYGVELFVDISMESA